MTNPEYTYHYDKLSCSKNIWIVHITFAFLVVLSGLGCLLARLFDKIRWMHPWFGRCYIIFMLWCMATSLVIHNSGLPIAVLFSFLWVLCGLTFGWIVIKLHQRHMENKVYKLINEIQPGAQLNRDDNKRSIEIEIENARKTIIQNNKFNERFFSYKALHGALMFTSFINVAGRIFAFHWDFTCHTYPYYKQIDTSKFKGLDKPLTAVQFHDPNYSDLPWAYKEGWWALWFSFGPMMLAFLVGCYFSWKNSKGVHQQIKKNYRDVAAVPIQLYSPSNSGNTPSP